MSRSSFPKRAIWPKLLPEFSPWSGVVGVLLSGISLILTGISDLNWWIKVGLCLVSLVVPIVAYVIWKNANIIWQRVKQYDLLYDDLEHAVSDNRQLQENFTFFLKSLLSAGLQVFEVTGIEWGNKSPLLVIACNQQLPVGSKLVVINVSTLDTLGRFEVMQATIGGYLAREERILNAVWWGLLHDEMAKYAHPRIVNAAAVLLH
jgi:hypothetical protein